MKKACYVAGPMTGYKDLNYPAFAHAAQCLRALGFGVVSPAELNPIETAYENAMRNDIHALADCSHIHLLDGWEKSKGANCEWHIAQLLGITRIGIDGEPVTTAAASPDPAAITRTFMEETFGPAAESDDIDSRMEKYGVAFAAIQYALAASPSGAANDMEAK